MINILTGVAEELRRVYMVKAKRFISLMMVILTIVSMFSIFTVSSSAASVKVNKHYTAQRGSSYTFKVTTSGAWYQGNASIKFHSAASVQNVGATAPTMVLAVKDHSTNKTTYKWITGNGDDYYSTLSLAKNRTFTITVSYLNDYSENSSIAVAVGKEWAKGYWEITGSTRVTFK